MDGRERAMRREEFENILDPYISRLIKEKVYKDKSFEKENSLISRKCCPWDFYSAISVVFY